MADTTKVIVKSPIRHNGKDFAPGKMLELPDEQVAPLLAVGAVEKPGKDGQAKDSK